MTGVETPARGQARPGQDGGQAQPLHDATPGIVLQGRWIILDEKPAGWHIGLLEDDAYFLLRVLPYGSRALARGHARAFADHYGADFEGER